MVVRPVTDALSNGELEGDRASFGRALAFCDVATRHRSISGLSFSWRAFRSSGLRPQSQNQTRKLHGATNGELWRRIEKSLRQVHQLTPQRERREVMQCPSLAGFLTRVLT